MRKLDKSRYSYTFVSNGPMSDDFGKKKPKLVTWNYQTGQHISRNIDTKKIMSVTPL